MHLPETDLEVGDGDVGVHPRVVENFFQSDPVVGRLQHPRNEVLGLLAHSLELGN